MALIYLLNVLVCFIRIIVIIGSRYNEVNINTRYANTKKIGIIHDLNYKGVNRKMIKASPNPGPVTSVSFARFKVL